MTENEIAKIEEELGIVLPAAYRNAVVPFPVRFYAGNSENELWDNPVALIELNRELRNQRPGFPDWPEHMFAVGCVDSDTIAIDVRNPTCPVWWAECGNLESQISETFEDFACKSFTAIRKILDFEGINPERRSEPWERVYVPFQRAAGRWFVGFAALSAVAALILCGIAKWLAQ